MLILRSLCALLLLCGVARAQDTVIRTVGAQSSMPIGQALVTPTGGTRQSLSAALAAASSGLVIGTSTITGTCTNGFVLYNNAGVVGCQAAGGGSGLTIGTSTITGGTTTRVLFDNAGVLGEYTISGSGNVAMTTSPTFVTPVLGTVAAGSILTNATGLPISTGVSGLGANVATALGIAIGSAGAPVVLNGVGGTPSSLTGTNITGTASGLTAGVATLANGLKSATTTVVVSAATAPTAGQVLTATSGTAADWESAIDPVCATWDSTTPVTAQTIDFPVAWATYTIGSVKAKVAGGGSFTYAVQIGGTPVTSCNVVTVNSSSNVNTTCTAANTGAVNSIVSVVIASPSGTVNQAYVCPVFSHSAN